MGNVDGHLLRDGRQERLVAYRGIVGAAIPKVRPFSYRLDNRWVLLIHTDGVRARFRVEDFPAQVQREPQRLADDILGVWSRETDDATVVVIGPSA